MDRIKKLGGRFKYKLANNTNTENTIELTSKTKVLPLDVVNEIVDVNDVFNQERENSGIYRFLGQLNFYMANKLNDQTLSIANEMIDPLFNGLTPNNWLIQITTPTTKSGNFLLEKKGDPTQTTSSRAYRGIQILGVTSVNITGNKNQLTITTAQEHKLNVGDYIYIYNVNLTVNGIHRVEYLGTNPNNTKNVIILDTTYDGGFSYNIGNIVRIVNPSYEDSNFLNSKTINQQKVCDINGGNTNTNYTQLSTTTPHSLFINNWIELRSGDNINDYNGLFKVVNVINDTNFIIEKYNTPGTSYLTLNYRVMDGTPCEYYVRYFEVLTTNQYSIHKTGYSSTIYPSSRDNSLGIGNGNYLYEFEKDVILDKFNKNHRGGPVNEVYLSVIKRSGENTYNWSNVVSDWDFNRTTTGGIDNPGIETISNNTPGGLGTINKPTQQTRITNSQGDVTITPGSIYLGDFVEYNSLEIREKVISEVIHRFGLNTNSIGEGFYYKPFKKISLRVFSNSIETAIKTNGVLPYEGIPVDSEETPLGNGNSIISWRDLLTVGFFEDGTNGVEYPFVNGSNYIYSNNSIYVRRQRVPLENIIDQSSVDFKLIC